MVNRPREFALRRGFVCEECLDLGIKFSNLNYDGAYTFTSHLTDVHKMTLYEFWEKRIRPRICW
jgi:hypothetical protein